MGVSALQVACAQLQATHHAPGRSLPRGIALTACRCDPPLSSNRPRIETVLVRFFYPTNFSRSNAKPMVNIGARDNVPTAVRRLQEVLFQYNNTPRICNYHHLSKFGSATFNSVRVASDPIYFMFGHIVTNQGRSQGPCLPRGPCLPPP